MDEFSEKRFRKGDRVRFTIAERKGGGGFPGTWLVRRICCHGTVEIGCLDEFGCQTGFRVDAYTFTLEPA